MKQSLLIFLLIFFCYGCVNIAGSKEPPVMVEDAFQSEGEGIISAIIAGDYRKYAQIVREPAISGDEQKFISSRENMLKTYGKPLMFRFLTFLRTPMLVNQIWVIDFARKVSNGQEIIQQQLFQLIFSNDDGRARLVGMRFI